VVVTDAVVKTDRGQLRGSVEGPVASFKGIPYAAAPEGALRFRPPVPAGAWDGVRDATSFGTAAPQAPATPGAPVIWSPVDGLDCLNLNVWTPDPGGAGLPVMVWLHGGAWKQGAGSNPGYDGTVLAGQGVVLVTLNYRLGFEGFGHLPGVPDNRGLRDQIAALEWVQANIADFGGYPGNVTVFGQSAGGGSVALLVAAVAGRGLFRRAIAQSVPEGYWPARRAERITAKVAAELGVPPTAEAFAELSPQALVAAQDAPLRTRGGITAFVPVIDGEVVTGTPWEALAGGAARGIDLVCGFTHEEYRLFMPAGLPAGGDLEGIVESYHLGADVAPAYRAAYPGVDPSELCITFLSDALFRLPSSWTAQAHADSGGRTWLYDFTWAGGRLGACHAVEVPFVFGHRGGGLAAWALGTPPPGEFEALSERMRASWVGFATTGDPGWPRFDTAGRLTRRWDNEVTDGPYPIEASHRIWAGALTSRPAPAAGA
jgi:carboxylesterase type B